MADLVLKSLVLKNFKSFSGSHEFALDRKAGLYYITGLNKLAPELGANGVGKSTLWDAVLWGLFGRTGRDNRPADAVKPWGGSGRTSVSLEFERGGETFFIWRARAPNELQVDGKNIEQEAIPKLLGMTEEMFRRTVILGQFGTLFLDLKPEHQAQMFTEALSLDVWMRAVAKAQEAARGAEGQARAAEIDLTVTERLTKELSDQIAEAASAAAGFEDERAGRVAMAEKKIAAVEADLKRIKIGGEPSIPKDSAREKLVGELVKLREELVLLEADLVSTRRDRERLVARLEKMKAQQKAPRKKCLECGQPIPAEDFTRKLEALVNEASALNEVCRNQEAEARTLEKRRQELDREVAAAKVRGEAVQKAYETAYQDWRAAIEEANALKREIKITIERLERERGAANPHAESAERLKKRRMQERGKLAALGARVTESRTALERATFWVDGFKEIRLGIIDETLIELEMASARHMAALGLDGWGIRFETERETKAGAVSRGFIVMLYPPDMEEPVKWESYSGGESQRLQLAVAFALSEILLSRAGLSPNFEVLDEPTRGLSVDGVEDLLEHLRDRAQELDRAIYFVDHHSLDKGAFDGTLLIEKTKKGSQARWV